MEDNNMLSKKKADIVRKIEENIERIGTGCGSYYVEAHFNYDKNHFDVYTRFDGSDKSVIFKNGEVYEGSVVSNGRYKNISLCGTDSLMEHQLLAICLIEGASERLINDDSAVINHKTIPYKAVEARIKRSLYLRKFNSAFSCNTDELDDVDESYKNEIYVPKCDVLDLELCTSAENYAHGALIKTFDLYDISISAHDVEALKKALINKEHVNNVMRCYKTYGVHLLKMVL